MKLLYATANKAKYSYMKDMLIDTGIELISLNDLRFNLPSIGESGNNPLDNAKIKAMAYYKVVGMPLFSCDSGLYIEGIDDSKQPGVHVRRVGGKVLTDDEMIDYYSNLAKEAGGEVVAWYKNAIALVLDENTCYTYNGEDIGSVKFHISSEVHEKRIPGFPLDSLSKEISTGRFYLDITRDRSSADNNMAAGYQSFFQRTVLKRCENRYVYTV